VIVLQGSTKFGIGILLQVLAEEIFFVNVLGVGDGAG
jgi:hypothetical protein